MSIATASRLELRGLVTKTFCYSQIPHIREEFSDSLGHGPFGLDRA